VSNAEKITLKTMKCLRPLDELPMLQTLSNLSHVERDVRFSSGKLAVLEKVKVTGGMVFVLHQCLLSWARVKIVADFRLTRDTSSLAHLR